MQNEGNRAGSVCRCHCAIVPLLMNCVNWENCLFNNRTDIAIFSLAFILMMCGKCVDKLKTKKEETFQKMTK